MMHVYLIPGMAANCSIFENLELPDHTFTLHSLNWLMPSSIDEDLQAYAKRFAAQITHKNPVLIGVSFGGILAQEIGQIIKVKQIIIISSVKSNTEFPLRFLIAKRLRLYKILPIQIFENIDRLSRLAFGKAVKNKISLYQKYMGLSDKLYLKWSLKSILCWSPSFVSKNIIHIHGTADTVFPVKNIKSCIRIHDASHILILTKYKWLNQNLPSMIIND